MRLIVLMSCFVAHSFSAPLIRFTDLSSGPNSGGPANNGAFVTIYGNRLVGAQSVTVGGGAVASIIRQDAGGAPLYLDRVTVQLGASAATGPVVVTVNGIASNSDVTFTVRSGNIRFIGPFGQLPFGTLNTAANCTKGADASTDYGMTTANPWNVNNTYILSGSSGFIEKCIAAGDILYFLDGFNATHNDGNNANIDIQSTGTVNSPIGLVAYPGATVQIGDGTVSYGVRQSGVSAAKDASYWTVAGLRMNSKEIGLLTANGAVGWRIIGNYFTCPHGGEGAGACIDTSLTSDMKLWGNEVTNAGCGELSGTPCQGSAGPGTATSSGTTLTLSSFHSSAHPIGTRIVSSGQERIVTSVQAGGTPTIVTTDTPFSPALSNAAYVAYPAVSNKLYHTVYFSTDSINIDFGWNYLHDNRACRGLQFHSSPVTTAAAPASTTGETRGGALSDRTYYIKTAYAEACPPGHAGCNNGYVRGAVGAEASRTVSAGSLLTVTTATNPCIGNFAQTQCNAGLFFDVYVSTQSGSGWTLQNASPVPIGSVWTEPDSGLVSGSAPGAGVTIYLNGWMQYGILVHDNFISDVTCDGINIQTSNPSLGGISIWNNVVMRAGAGPDPVGGSASYTCLYTPGENSFDNIGAIPTGNIDVYNNTFVNCGLRGGSAAASLNRGGGGAVTITMRNNISVQPSGGAWHVSGTSTGLLSGTNNTWYGLAAPAYTTSQVTSDPLLDPDGTLGPGSTSRIAGTTDAPVAIHDIVGNVRPSPPSIGAYEGSATRRKITAGSSRGGGSVRR